MFCTKCGKPNDDDATFCEYCGAPISAHGQTTVAPPPTYPTPTYQTPPYPQAYAVPAPRKGRKGVVIAIVAVVVLLAVAAGLYFFVLRDKSGGGQISGPPTMTVNGEDIPLLLSGCAGDKDSSDYRVLFMGKKDNRYFITSVALSPSSNKTYSLGSFGNNVVVGFSYYDLTNNASGFISSNYLSGFYTAEVKTGKFKQNESFGISVSGKAEDDGLTFEFSASGVIDLYDHDELMKKQDSIYKEILALF